MEELEEAIIRECYGKYATPILIEDKSIEGLIRANCPKKEKSLFAVFNLMKV